MVALTVSARQAGFVRTRRALSLSLIAAGVTACAAPTATSKTRAQRERLEEFSAALAQAGMSVPLPPRICEDSPARLPVVEGTRGVAVVSFNDEIACVDAPADARLEDIVTTYARALVFLRIPGATDERADALARAFLRGDPALAPMAAAIEGEFDARRLARKVPPQGGKPTPRRPNKGGPNVDARALDGGVASVDSMPIMVEAEVDAGVLDGTLPSTIYEQLIGTWATTKPGPFVDLYALCADGAWMLRYEASNDIGRRALGDLEPRHGTWEAVDGDPPTITLIDGDAEKQQGTIPSLTDEAVEIAFDGEDEVMKLIRRSKAAVCD